MKEVSLLKNLQTYMDSERVLWATLCKYIWQVNTYIEKHNSSKHKKNFKDEYLKIN